MAKLDDKKKCKKFPFADVLKWAIFSLVMLAPFGAVLGKIAYVTFNKNAKDSYTKENTAQNWLKVTNQSQFMVNQDYYISYINNPNGTNYSPVFYYNSISINWTDYGADSNNYDGFQTLQDGRIQLFNSTLGTNPHFNMGWGWNLKNIQINLKSINGTDRLNGGNENAYLTILNQKTLDNAFYESIEEINNKPIFSWTQNTAMYTVIDSMTNDLEINTDNGNILATLLTYWTLNTAVYLIFDVVIHFSTKLVHMFSGE